MKDNALYNTIITIMKDHKDCMDEMSCGAECKLPNGKYLVIYSFGAKKHKYEGYNGWFNSNLLPNLNTYDRTKNGAMIKLFKQIKEYSEEALKPAGIKKHGNYKLTEYP